MAAGLQLKNALTSKDPEVRLKYQERWLQFPLDIRNYIKQNVSMLTLFPFLRRFIEHIGFNPTYQIT